MKHRLIVLLAFSFLVSVCASTRVPHILLAAGLASADTIPVPQGIIDQITTALGLAESGDILLVSNQNPLNPAIAYKPFTMKPGVQVLAQSGQTPLIDGSDTVATAVSWPSNADENTILDGFTIRGGTSQVVSISGSGEIRNCTIENEGASGLTKGIVNDDYTTITNCTVTMSGSQGNYGIYNTRRSPIITGCVLTLSGTGSQYGIRSVTAAPYYGSPEVSGCTITITGSATSYGIYNDGGTPGITDCTVDVATGYGLYVGALSATTGGEISHSRITIGDGDGVATTTGSFAVHDLTVNGGGYNHAGILCGNSIGQFRSTISNCLLVMDGGVGVWIVDDSTKVENVTVISGGGEGIYSGYGTVTVRNCIVSGAQEDYGFENVNAVYCIGDGDDPYHGSSQDTTSVVEDPLFCDAAHGIYTLRVDSYGNPKNNDSELPIGAFPVSCMFGTLVRDAEYDGGGALYVPGDVTIPSGKSLTLDAATTVEMNTTDSLSAGLDHGSVEMTVESGGALSARGDEQHPVRFVSKATNPGEGEWWGIVGNGCGNGALVMDHAEVSHSSYGVSVAVTSAGDTCASISHSQFSGNESWDMLFSGSGAVSLVGNDVNVDGGQGVILESLGGGTVASNLIYGTFSSSNGLHFYSNSDYDQAVLVLGNEITGFPFGNCAWIEISPECEHVPVFQGNEFSDSNRGLYITKASAVVGGSSTEEGNRFDGNATGLYVRCIGGGTCPGCISSDVLVRHNYFTDSSSLCIGIVSEKTAAVDAGTSEDYGYNSFHSAYQCIRNNSQCGMLQAQGNYFGTCDNGHYCADSITPVNAAHWLCDDPWEPAGFVAKVEALGKPHLKILPAPSLGSTRIRFDLAGTGAAVRGEVFSVTGRLERDLGWQQVGAGVNELAWDGRASTGQRLASGIHFVRLRTDTGLHATAKLLVLGNGR